MSVAVTILDGEPCRLGEGPAYDPGTGTLWWCDIIEKRLHSRRHADGARRTVQLAEMPSAVATGKDGGFFVVTETGLHGLDPETGALSAVCQIEADNPVTRSNDSRVHPSGAFWIGTMGKQAETGAGSIWWFRGGELRRLWAGLSIPNSICFSPDGATGYFTDTAINRLMRVALDPATGLPAAEPSVLVDTTARPGGLDGSVCDADGVIWNARWGAGLLDAYSPDGALLRCIAIPAKQATCPAFVGPALDRLIVTSAWQGLDDAARAADPDAGRTFHVDLPVRGRPEPLLFV